MANEIARFVGLIFLKKFTLSESVTRVGRLVRVLKDRWQCKKVHIIFNVQQNRVVCKLGDYYYYFFLGQWDCWI
jgi:hypothetical protein